MLGHEITVVGDGKQALEAVTTDHYDLVFMDIQMPVMDGVQATLAIREMERQGLLRDKTLIVAMTANALKGDKDKYLAVGMDAYLSKPILLEELRNTISSLISPDGNKLDQGASASKVEPSWCSIHDAFRNSPRHVSSKPLERETPQTAPLPQRQDEAEKQGKPAATDPATEKNRERAKNADSGASAIDWELLELSFAGNPEFIVDSMTLYMRDAPKLLQEAISAAERTDNAGLTVNTHALKGITSYFTRTGAYSLCLDLEELGRENALPANRPEVNRLLNLLRGHMDQLYTEMQTAMKRYAGSA